MIISYLLGTYIVLYLIFFHDVIKVIGASSFLCAAKSRIVCSNEYSSICKCLDSHVSNLSGDESEFVLTKYGPIRSEKMMDIKERWWGVRPMLIRQAYDPDVVSQEDGWPTFDDILELACDEDAESRLITRDENNDFLLELGPFEREDIQDLLNGKAPFNDIANHTPWSLLVNDVDRFLPSVSDWIDENFSFIPNWRRDDGQISVACCNGGIGLHVDDYDVFLIQTCGTRIWRVANHFISHEIENTHLIPGLDVRVLNETSLETNTEDFSLVEIMLKPGDVLYLPPRIPHWGIAYSDNCATFSVGCRAPSSSDLIERFAENLSYQVTGSGVKRYEDSDLAIISRYDKGEITDSAKVKAKTLIRDTVEEFLSNDDFFDEWFGTFATEPKRVRIGYPIPIESTVDGSCDDDDEFRDPTEIMDAFCSGSLYLHQAEGLAFAYSKISSNIYRLFANGNCFEVSNSVPVDIISNNKRLFIDNFGGNINSETRTLLNDLLTKGIVYESE